jgi:hypothetical protein
MQVIKVTATGLVYTGHTRVEGVNLVPAAADATITLSDSLDGLSNDRGGAKAEAEYSIESCLYGQSFRTGIYATLSGAGAVAYIYVQ